MTSERIVKLRELRGITAASMTECSALLDRFEGNLEQAIDHWFGRRPDPLLDVLGFQNPFPVKLPRPEGGAVYDTFISLTLRYDGAKVRLELVTQWSETKGMGLDSVRCTVKQEFLHLPDVRSPEDAFQHWVPAVREVYKSDQERNGPLIGDDSFFTDPDSWTFAEFQRRGGVGVRKAGKGVLLTAGMGCLGYAGGYAKLYLISPDGEEGALRTVHEWSHHYFDLDKMRIGCRGEWPALPVLTSQPLELIHSDSSS